MNTLSLLTAILVMQGGGAKPKFSIDVFHLRGSERVAVKNGDALKGDVVFRVVPQTTNPIQAIELYVGDDLRDTDASTPYEFKVDTLAEDDGDIKLRFKGFTSEGENAEKVYTLKVDNSVSLGAEAHVKLGNELLGDAKYDDAITEARIALKADKDNLAARLLLGRANLGLAQYDKAQKYAEDVLQMDKKSRDAKELLVSLNVQRGFGATSKSSGDRKEVLQTITKAFTTAARYRVEARDEAFDSMNPDATSTEYIDAAIRAKRFAKVVEILEKPLAADFKRTDLANRLIYSYLMLNRPTDAESYLKSFAKLGQFDAYTYALQAVVANEFGLDTASDNAIKEALLNSPDSLGLKTAQAFIAIKRNKPSALSDAAQSLIRENESRPESHYFAAALHNRLNRLNLSRASFERAIKADAADHDMFVEQGNQAIVMSQTPKLDAKDKEFQLDYAKAMYTIALECRSSSAQALTGLAIVNLMQNKVSDALRMSEAATRAGGNYAAAWYAYATALDQRDGDLSRAITAVVGQISNDPNNDSLKTRRAAYEAEKKTIVPIRLNAKTKAEALDAKALKGRANLDTEQLFRYFNAGGRTPVLSPPALG